MFPHWGEWFPAHKLPNVVDAKYRIPFRRLEFWCALWQKTPMWPASWWKPQTRSLGRHFTCRHDLMLGKLSMSWMTPQGKTLGSFYLISSGLIHARFSLFWFCFVYSDIINQSHKYDYMVSSVVLLTNHQIWGKPWGSPTHYPLLHVRTLIDAGQSAYPQSLATVMSSGIGL